MLWLTRRDSHRNSETAPGFTAQALSARRRATTETMLGKSTKENDVAKLYFRSPY